MKTLIIGYGLPNISIQINLVTNCKTCVSLVQQQLVQVQFSFFIGFKSFIITRLINFFIYYALSKQKFKKYNINNCKIRIMIGVNLIPLVQNEFFLLVDKELNFCAHQQLKATLKIIVFCIIALSYCRDCIINVVLILDTK